jgi:hypothetical protein
MANESQSTVNKLLYLFIILLSIGIIMTSIAIALYESQSGGYTCWILLSIGAFLAIGSAITLIVLSLNWDQKNPKE